MTATATTGPDIDAVEHALRAEMHRRISRGDTLAGISHQAGLHPTPVYRWWKGRQTLTLISFSALCAATDMQLVPIAAATKTTSKSRKGRAAE
jgi:DNA-binding phage protein